MTMKDIYLIKESKKKLNREILKHKIYKKFDKQITSTALVINNNHVITAYKIQKRIWN